MQHIEVFDVIRLIISDSIQREKQERINKYKMKIFVFFLFCGIAHAADWSYEGSEGVVKWPQLYENCRQERQSPINITHDSMYRNFPAFELTGYNDMSGLLVTNNGHTVQIDILPASLGNNKLRGGGLNGTYIPLQLHFHWGENDYLGSEHLFRGTPHPLELHVVHFKEEYGTVSEAVKHGDGLAVLGFFFMTKDAEENTDLKPLIDSLHGLDYKEKKNISINFADIMPSTDSSFFRYDGSLTTPTCDEVVVWTVFDIPATISSAQLAKFRKLKDSHGSDIEWNYRPVQALYGREIYQNFEGDVSPNFHWGYKGYEAPAYWKNYYKICGYDQQSPIDIPIVDNLAPFDENLELDSLEFMNYDKPFQGKIKNNGHTVQIDLDDSIKDIKLRKGGLRGDYVVAQFHFHWGQNDNEGSEHTLEGKAYPLEMHIVHYKEEYGNLTEAVKRDDGLAVVGVFITTGAEIVNRHYGKIVSELPDVKYKNAKKDISGFNLKQLINHELKLNATTGLHSPFYRYMGSLTTPGCLEIVTWTVLKYPVYISQEQLEAFRMVTHITSGPVGSHDYIEKNFRPVQSLAGRKVYQSIDFSTLTIAGTSGLLPSMISMATILVMIVLL